MSKEAIFFGNAKEKFEELQRSQSALATKFLDSGIELQKKQYELLGSIIQNQIEFGSRLFSETLNLNNDNEQPRNAKEKTKG